MFCVGQLERHLQRVFFPLLAWNSWKKKKPNRWKRSSWVHRNVWSCSYYLKTFVVAVFTWICDTEHRFLRTQVLVFMKQFAVIPCLPQNVQPILWKAERRQFQTLPLVSLKDGQEDGAEWSRSLKNLGREGLGSALGSEMCSDTFTLRKNCTADGDLLTSLGLFQALTFFQAYSMASWSFWVMLYLCFSEWYA